MQAHISLANSHTLSFGNNRVEFMHDLCNREHRMMKLKIIEMEGAVLMVKGSYCFKSPNILIQLLYRTAVKLPD